MAASIAVVQSVTARVSVLPDVGSELLTVSDVAAVVCAAPAYEVGNGALDVVGLSVGQSFVRMNSEDTLPALQDERSVMSFLVRPAAILISQSFYRTMNVVMMDSHRGCVFVGLWSATWTLIPFGWYIGNIAGPLRPGLILEYLSGGECYVVLLDCLVCRSFRIRPA